MNLSAIKIDVFITDYYYIMEEKLLNLITNYLEYADLYPCNPSVILNKNNDFQIVTSEELDSSLYSEPIVHFLCKNKSRGIYEPDRAALERLAEKFGR